MSSVTKPLSRSRKRKPVPKIISFILLLIICIIWLLPIVYMLGNSFKDEIDVLNNPTGLLPSAGHWTIDNYAGFIWRDGKIDNMPLWMLNSFIVAVFKIVLTLLIDCFAAYAFVFMKFKGRKSILAFLIASMTIPGVIATTSMFTMYASTAKAFELVNAKWYTYVWLIIPGLSGVYNMLLVRNFFLSIPKDIVESARADGASNMRIFWTIIVPLAKSTILLIVLFTFTGAWNDLMWPSMLLSGKGQDWMTVTVALASFAQGDGMSNLGVNMATATFSLIPIMIVFFIAQNKMIEGLATTGTKG